MLGHAAAPSTYQLTTACSCDVVCSGFDPLSLGADANNLKWYVQAELQNGRWAMLAVAGILFPELLSSIGFSWPGAGVSGGSNACVLSSILSSSSSSSSSS
jgi:hypothetical protein